MLLLALCSVALLGAAIWLVRFRQPGAAVSGVPAELAFYGDLLGPLETVNRDILLVLSNPKVVLYYGRKTSTPGLDGQGPTIPAPHELKKKASATR